MDPIVAEWGNLLLRWAHIITAMAWIGSSFYFMHLDATLTDDVACGCHAINGLLLVACVAGGMLLPLIARVLRFRGPAQLGLARDGDAGAGAMATAPAPRPLAQDGRPTVLLWSAAAAFALGLMVQIGFVTHHVLLAEPLLGTTGAGLLVSATGGAALIGRLILASIVDRINVRSLAGLAMIGQTLALLGMALWPGVPMLVAASLLYGYGIGHVTTLAPVVVRREFGAAAFGATYGSAATLIQFTSALGPALLGLLRDAFGGYRPGLALAAVLTAIASLVLLLGGRIGRHPSSGA
jgi:hypothetical protein